MKELSIEQKALAYDEALDIAKHYHSGMGDDVKCVLEEVFSELRESDDESEDDKIRKAIIDTIKSQKEQQCHIDSTIYDEMLAWLEKQGEHESADKIEPKFNVGDWLQYRNAKPFLVEEITEQGYVNGDLCLPFERENEIHLWTIQDAKPGDILISCGLPFIFKEWNNNCVSYGGINLDGKFIESGWCSWCSSIGVTPTTKEQRDFLFQKMHEAGYEWDSEKKELKKVGQELTELAKGEDYGIDGLYAAVDILQKTLGKVDGYQTDDGILEHACAISAVKELYEQKHAWSERVQPQSKQEWKQENTGDLTDFENAMMHIGDSFFGQHAGLDPNNTNAIKEQANLLLEFIPSKEWSEKDNRLLNDAISLADECDDFELRDWLKSLKAKYTWKPNDEQMDVLQYLCETSSHPNEKVIPILESLYQDLKKLKGE